MFFLMSACASEDKLVISVPMTKPVSSQLSGNDVLQANVNQDLVSAAISDAKSTVGKSVSFLKLIRNGDGIIYYVFLIDRVDDNFLVYQSNSDNTGFTRKFYYAALHL
ncbi:hypothetical protein [Pseudoxanthomonas wuyuanensis]|uniref:hypothetical protein n=1 Tax=Pseudoxanthomonas wuyuanensis TaxID=1073196 RepID=UPI0011413E0B|nr:hypothetical protein [Pseudoxanthomonas wuyuanensis]